MPVRLFHGKGREQHASWGNISCPGQGSCPMEELWDHLFLETQEPVTPVAAAGCCGQLRGSTCTSGSVRQGWAVAGPASATDTKENNVFWANSPPVTPFHTVLVQGTGTGRGQQHRVTGGESLHHPQQHLWVSVTLLQVLATFPATIINYLYLPINWNSYLVFIFGTDRWGAAWFHVAMVVQPGFMWGWTPRQ